MLRLRQPNLNLTLIFTTLNDIFITFLNNEYITHYFCSSGVYQITDVRIEFSSQCVSVYAAPNGVLVPAKIVQQPDGDYKVEYSSKFTGAYAYLVTRTETTHICVTERLNNMPDMCCRSTQGRSTLQWSAHHG